MEYPPEKSETDSHENLKKVRDWIKGRHEFYVWLASAHPKILPDKDEVLAERIKGVVDEIKTELTVPQYDCASLLCDVACGATCCHFSPSNMVPGVLIEKDLIPKIKSILDSAGENINDYVTARRWSKLTSHQRNWIKENFDPEEYLMELAGVEVVCHTSINLKRPVAPTLVYNTPKTLDGLYLWVDSKSCDCRFLTEDSRCMLCEPVFNPRVGVSLGCSTNSRPKTCIAFICSTGYALHVLQSIGMLKPFEYADKNMGELNTLAETGLSFLLARLLTEEFRELEGKRENLLMDVLLAYPENRFRLEKDLNDLEDLNRRHEDMKKKAVHEARTKILQSMKPA